MSDYKFPVASKSFSWSEITECGKTNDFHYKISC